MSDAPLRPGPFSSQTREQELAAELRKIERRDWWVWGYAILVILLLTFAVIALALPALLAGAETYFNTKVTEAVFGLVILVLIFNLYTVYQQILIKRLRRQLAEKQGHSDILRNLAMMDPLTGLYNRRFAEQRLAAEVARSERKGHPLTVLMLDLNNFKQINDAHGHAAGDQVLKEFAFRLNKVIRGSDLAVRLGGDEFLVLLPECTTKQLQIVLGRLGSIEVERLGQKIPVTFSAGWKQYEIGDRPEELLESADQLLYETKRASKESTGAADSTESKPAPFHVLVDLVCPHCRKGNLVAVNTHAGGRDPGQKQVTCAHCSQVWEPPLPGALLSGPFPK
jgi:diguanylate cyclase (GGDEF)-like protein